MPALCIMHGQILFTLDMYNINWHGKHHTRDTKKKKPTHNVKHINIYLYICIIGHIGEKQEWYIYNTNIDYWKIHQLSCKTKF